MWVIKMDYKKIYKQIINKARLDHRVKIKGSCYYESHHIIPDFMFLNRKRKGPKGHIGGNPTDKSNLVLLTPREHFICHVLLYKIYKGTHYEYSVGSALGFFFTKMGHPRKHWFNSSKKYEGWRLAGLQSISRARSGTMPVKEFDTGVIIGSVKTDHPNILSGKWVHTTKGRIISKQELDSRGSNIGDSNSNFKNLTPEIEKVLYNCVNDSCVVDNHLIKNLFELEIKKQLVPIFFKKVSYQFIINKYGSIQTFLLKYNEDTSNHVLYDPYYRSRDEKLKISKKGKQRCWMSNSNTIIMTTRDQITKYEHLGYIQGRKINVKN